MKIAVLLMPLLVLLNAVIGDSFSTRELALDGEVRRQRRRSLMPSFSIRPFFLVIQSPNFDQWLYTYNSIPKIAINVASQTFIGGFGIPGYASANNPFRVLLNGTTIDPLTTWRLYVDNVLVACGAGGSDETYDGLPMLLLMNVLDEVAEMSEDLCVAEFPPNVYNPAELDRSCRVCQDDDDDFFGDSPEVLPPLTACPDGLPANPRMPDLGFCSEELRCQYEIQSCCDIDFSQYTCFCGAGESLTCFKIPICDFFANRCEDLPDGLLDMMVDSTDMTDMMDMLNTTDMMVPVTDTCPDEAPDGMVFCTVGLTCQYDTQTCVCGDMTYFDCTSTTAAPTSSPTEDDGIVNPSSSLFIMECPAGIPLNIMPPPLCSMDMNCTISTTTCCGQEFPQIVCSCDMGEGFIVDGVGRCLISTFCNDIDCDALTDDMDAMSEDMTMPLIMDCPADPTAEEFMCAKDLTCPAPNGQICSCTNMTKMECIDTLAPSAGMTSPPTDSPTMMDVLPSPFVGDVRCPTTIGELASLSTCGAHPLKCGLRPRTCCEDVVAGGIQVNQIQCECEAFQNFKCIATLMCVDCAAMLMSGITDPMDDMITLPAIMECPERPLDLGEMVMCAVDLDCDNGCSCSEMGYMTC